LQTGRHPKGWRPVSFYQPVREDGGVVSTTSRRIRKLIAALGRERALRSGCSKAWYPDQAAARDALAKVEPGARPLRVYPCDRCDGWHLTSKPNRGKTPQWDRDPNWSRPRAD
jgi:hypothetical protein